MESSKFYVEDIKKLQDNFKSPLESLNLMEYQNKILKIEKACERRSLQTLRELAVSKGGFILDSLRLQAWPILLGLRENVCRTQEESLGNINWENLPVHPDEDQVRLDVNRSFIYYPHGQSQNELFRRRKELLRLITELLRSLPYLSYFQGFHDICQVFMLVLEPQSLRPVIARLSALKIRDFMLPTFSHALAQLHLIPSIIHRANPKLWDHLLETQPFFALSGTITMYAHEIQDYGEIARLFDALLAREAIFSIYVFAQIVLRRSDEIFATPSDEPEILHSVLSKLPRHLAVDDLIENTVRLFEMHPPESLKGWKSISSYSVLKTTRWPDQVVEQSLDEGREFFQRQVKELKWAEKREIVLKTIRKYRRPVLTMGIPILLGILSYWYKSSGSSRAFGMWLESRN